MPFAATRGDLLSNTIHVFAFPPKDALLVETDMVTVEGENLDPKPPDPGVFQSQWILFQDLLHMVLLLLILLWDRIQWPCPQMFLSLQGLSFASMFLMNSLVWNCRGAGGKDFPALVCDYIKIYNLNFVAILEPKVSGPRADVIVKKIGLEGCVRVEASGFLGGIWCLWNTSRLNIVVLATTTSCVHLKINPNSPSPWFMTIV